MIETNYFLLNQEQYQEFYTAAQELGISIDYYLDEFCSIEGPYIYNE
jgi:hypothetical protein